MIDLGAHRAAVRAMVCTYCTERSGVVPHHVRLRGTCGTALKPPDWQVVPACRACHSRIHAEGYTLAEWTRTLEVLARLQGELLAVAVSGEDGF